jgi:ABC-type transport system involved in cytochrome c biogenesis permease subunit
MILSVIVYTSAAVSVIIQAASLFSDRLKKRTLVPLINTVSAILLLTMLISRSIKIGFPALTGTFESLIFYAFCIFLISTAYGLQKELQIYPLIQFFASVTALGLLLVASSPLVGKELNPPIPALQSGWLLLHVAFSFIGEAFFAFSFITSILVLSSKDKSKQIQYDRLTYTAITIGYPIFTLGAMIFGAIWAEAAWGSFWSWDPKETWALITWLVYSLYLHFRLIRKSNYRRCSQIAVIGFLSTLFTFFGVNYLLSGLHSYN